MRRLAPIVALAVAVACGAVPAAAAAAAPPRIAIFTTMPPTAGVQLTYRGRTFKTGSDGSVTIDVSQTPRSADPRFEVRVRSRQVGADRRVRFSRWLGDVRRPVAALETERLVSWRFVDLGGTTVDPTRVQQLVLKSVTGEVTTYRGADLTRPHWLLAQRIVPISGGTEARDLYYSVRRIDVLRSNVVNASQQRFEPTSDTRLTFRLSFYPLRLQAEDALFGRPTGKRARVEFPDGHVEEVPLEHGVIQLSSLPRGTYNVTVQGGAFSFRTPVAVSKPQNAVFPVVTYLDVVVGAGTLLSLAIALLLIGRPSLAMAPVVAVRRIRGVSSEAATRLRPRREEST